MEHNIKRERMILMVKIALDAGHGINTAGKRTPDGKREWSFNEVVVRSVISELNKYKSVFILRLDDPTGRTDVPLITRTNKANKWKADVLVSVHHNALAGRWGTHGGVETFTYSGSMANQTSPKIAKLIHPRIVKAMGLRDRGVKRANLHMLRASYMPAVLTEGGFMDSTIDIKEMNNDARLKAQGVAIANGLVAHFKLKKKTTKPTKPSGSGLYRIQVGAYGVKSNADRALAVAKRRYPDAYISGTGIYRIQIGAYGVRANAERALKNAKKLYSDAYINRG